MKCSVFIATSADGYIATVDGDISWLEEAGEPAADMGFNDYIASVDCMIMGRKSMEKISSFNLTPEQWPYGDTRIIVLSRTLTRAPDNLRNKVEIYSGDIRQLITDLESEGLHHAYVDGGATITTFLNLGLIDEMTVTRAPVLLGEGIPLFGHIQTTLGLTDSQAVVYPNGFIQIKNRVNYL